MLIFLELCSQVRNAAAYHAIHLGPGVFDDFSWLFLASKRAGVPPSTIAAAESRFQSVFRLSIADFIFVRKHVSKIICRRRDKRGRKPIPINTVISTALLYLATGCTYQTAAIMITAS